MKAELTYLLVNLSAVVVPFLFSFHPKLRFNTYWKPALLSIFITAIPFILWDILFTHIGVWGFNPNYLTGIYIANLPIEELLFFLCIPYSCLFTYHCFQVLIRPFRWVNVKHVSLALCTFSLLLSSFFYDRQYTNTTFIALFISLLLIQWVLKSPWLNRLYLSYFVLLLPFFIVNGILTGTGLDNPIVWYNPDEIIGVRLLTIPFEDGFYGFLLILWNTLLFEKLSTYFKIKRD